MHGALPGRLAPDDLELALAHGGEECFNAELAWVGYCRGASLADDAANEVEAIGVAVKAAEKAAKKAEAARDKATKEAATLRAKIAAADDELAGLEGAQAALSAARDEASQRCEDAAAALSEKKRKLEALSGDVDAIKAVEADIQNQIDDYARALKENADKVKHWTKELAKLHKDHAREVADFADVFADIAADCLDDVEAAALQLCVARKDPDLSAVLEVYRVTGDKPDLQDSLKRIARRTIDATIEAGLPDDIENADPNQ